MHESMKVERELVAAMLAGDERAFTTFFETYFPRVYRFALPRMNRNADATKDVVQATLVKAMRAVGDWRGEAALFTWLCQICRRQVADHVRSERRHASKVVLIDDSEEVRAALESIAAPSTDDPLHGADRAELGRLVHACSTAANRYGDAPGMGSRRKAARSAGQIAFREGVEAVFGASADDVLASLEA
jgi:RNA polymerase sigma-70 factor (ECF subfamily)